MEETFKSPISHQGKKREKAVPFEAGVQIILLTNSVYYFLEFVFILIEKGTFRLVVLHKNRPLTDYRYKSLKGAKIAFTKYYGKKRWRENVEPDWTCAYHPEAAWLGDKLKKIEGN